MMKKISVSLPCRNEEGNIIPITEKIIEQFETHLPQYDYEIQFIDNCSTDNTRNELREVCAKYPKVRAILNVASFSNSNFYSMLQTTGDCCILMVSDFQEPPEMIPVFVKEWEKGAKVVCGVKTSSKENRLMWEIRSLYYKIMIKFSDVQQIQHFTGFGLYDRDFVEIMRTIEDPLPSFRGLVAEYGYDMVQVYYEQQARNKGKTKNNFFALVNIAMNNLTTYTKTGPRIATFGGIIIGFISVVIGLVYLVLKLMYWDRFSAGMAPMLIGIFFLGAVQLFFLGLLGEYVMAVNVRSMKKPLVVEQERINFPPGEERPKRKSE